MQREVWMQTPSWQIDNNTCSLLLTLQADETEVKPSAGATSALRDTASRDRPLVPLPALRGAANWGAGELRSQQVTTSLRGSRQTHHRQKPEKHSGFQYWSPLAHSPPPHTHLMSEKSMNRQIYSGCKPSKSSGICVFFWVWSSGGYSRLGGKKEKEKKRWGGVNWSWGVGSRKFL